MSYVYHITIAMQQGRGSDLEELSPPTLMTKQQKDEEDIVLETWW